jgi:hypothetical protein
LEVVVVRSLLLMLLVLSNVGLTGLGVAGEATPKPASTPASPDDGKVLHKGRLVTPEEKSKLEQGLVLYEGKWIPEEEWYTVRGYVKHLGMWVKKERLPSIQRRQEQVRERNKLASNWANAWVHNTKQGHFVIKSNVSPELVIDIGLAMELCYKELAEVFNVTKPIQGISVEVYATQELFMSESAKAKIPISATALGYFYYGPSIGIRAFYAGSLDQTLNTLYHECTHLVINQACGRAPTWTNEGIAVFFESAQRDEKEIKLDSIPFSRLWQLKRMLQKDEISLNRLCQLQGPEQYTGEYYPQGWGLFYYLFNAEKGKYRRTLGNYFSVLTSKKWDGDNMGLFKKSFGREPQTFYDDWKSYIMAIEPKTTEEYIAATIASFSEWLDFERAQKYAEKALELGKGKDEDVFLCNARLYLTKARWSNSPRQKADNYAKSISFFEMIYPPKTGDPKTWKPAKYRKMTQAYAAEQLDFARACIGAGRYEQAQDILEELLSKKQFEFNPQVYSMLAYMAVVAEDPAFKSLEVAKENAQLAEDLGADQENKYVRALIAVAEGNKGAAAKLLSEAAARDEFGFGGQFFRRELARLTGGVANP